MRRVLVTWVGRTDLRAVTEADAVGLGPIAQALDARQFDEVFLLSDYAETHVKPYVKWLTGRSKARIELLLEKLSGPMNFGEIYEAGVRSCLRALGDKPRETTLTFHLSPGTPAMAAVWILLGKTRFPADLLESSREHGVKTASVPFDISADFIPDLLRQQDDRLREQSAAEPPPSPEFADIIHRSRVMARLVQRARRVAVRNVPVLIEGESGTGKEMLARAIHRSSLRRDKPFIAVNCGAMPAELVESELFGHEKGAFTGAGQAKRGYFEAADGGTLFLDELGELAVPAQVKLLRVIQESEVVHLGSTKPLKIDVRIIAATNRTLTDEIATGRFREDLFYRLAVLVLKIPPLRDRAGDMGLLIDRLLEQVNLEARGEPGFREKTLSAAAKNLLLSYGWPGNVRELLNTLQRAAIWSDGATISAEDAREALISATPAPSQGVLGRPLGGGLNLSDLLKEVARHYLGRAMDEAHGNKTQAAQLVGLPSYQTLTNWLARYEVNDGTEPAQGTREGDDAMNQSSTEADARIVIDDLLRTAGWAPADKSQVRTEVPTRVPASSGGVLGVAEPISAYGDVPVEAEPDGSGRVDYVLYAQNGRPLAVIEAKKQAVHPYVAKQQALPYAKLLDAPFIFLTNGELIYFWDYQNDDARIVNSFFSRRDLERLVEMRSTRKPLATVAIPDHYIRQGETRAVRPYQQDAMRALDRAVELGKRRFLIELPTGTGKTDLIALYLKRLIELGRAERILFLVDRDQLAKQALAALQDILSGHPSYWLRAGMQRQEQQITVCLLQTMVGRYQEYTSGYFDVVVVDESHRSIYGAWQVALTHFDSLHIGLTATPASYIERNTFDFYHCKDQQPDFSYPIQEAFKRGHLVPYRFATGITEIISAGADINEEHYDPAEFERKWTNEKTNRLMMEEFDRRAHEQYQELAPGQKTAPGKAIVFAITKHHAARLAQYLNELHPEQQGRYAEVITSDIADADDAIRRFKQDPYPQVAVSVGMLDTGFDCREVLHLVMARRVRSPILYQQMRGRGTRTAPHIGKEKFVIYDFFGNHQYFNDSDTDIFTGTGRGHAPGGKKTGPKPSQNLIELGLEDEWLEAVTYVEVGPDGERVDKREYVTHWEDAVRKQADADAILGKVRSAQPLSPEEEENLAKRLNQPKYYFNEENLRRAYRNPGGTLVDFVRAALGMIQVKSRKDRLDENFRAWLVTKSLTPEQAQYLALLKNRGIARGKLALEDLFQPPLSILNAAGIGVELFGEDGLKSVVKDMNESVFAPLRSSGGSTGA